MREQRQTITKPQTTGGGGVSTFKLILRGMIFLCTLGLGIYYPVLIYLYVVQVPEVVR
jgi:hypothetical protein